MKRTIHGRLGKSRRKDGNQAARRRSLPLAEAGCFRLVLALSRRERREAREAFGFAALAEREELGREIRPGQEAISLPRTAPDPNPGPALRRRATNGSVPSPPPLGLRRSSRSPGRSREETGSGAGEAEKTRTSPARSGGAPLVFHSGSVRRQGCEACRCGNRIRCHDRRLGRAPRAADPHSHSQACERCQEQIGNITEAASRQASSEGLIAASGKAAPHLPLPLAGRGEGWFGRVRESDTKALSRPASFSSEWRALTFRPPPGASRSPSPQGGGKMALHPEDDPLPSLPSPVRRIGGMTPTSTVPCHSAGPADRTGRSEAEGRDEVPQKGIHTATVTDGAAGSPPPCGEGQGGGVSATPSSAIAHTPTSTSSPQGGGEPVAPRDNDLRKRKPISGLPEMGGEEGSRCAREAHLGRPERVEGWLTHRRLTQGKPTALLDPSNRPESPWRSLLSG